MTLFWSTFGCIGVVRWMTTDLKKVRHKLTVFFHFDQLWNSVRVKTQQKWRADSFLAVMPSALSGGPIYLEFWRFRDNYRQIRSSFFRGLSLELQLKNRYIKSGLNLPPLPEELLEEFVELSSNSFAFAGRFGLERLVFWTFGLLRTRIDFENSGGLKSGKSSLIAFTQVWSGEKTLKGIKN